MTGYSTAPKHCKQSLFITELFLLVFGIKVHSLAVFGDPESLKLPDILLSDGLEFELRRARLYQQNRAILAVSVTYPRRRDLAR